MDEIEIVLKQFDQVKLLTTSRITYLSAPPNTPCSPQGLWTIAAVVSGDLLLTKDNIVIRVNPLDVIKINEYNIDNQSEILRGIISDGRKKRQR